jgi:hypothetical protein
MKKYALIIILIFFTFSACKKDISSNNSTQKKDLTLANNAAKEVINDIKSYKSVYTGEYAKNATGLDASSDNRFREFIQNKFGAVGVDKIYTPLQEKFDKINFSLPMFERQKDKLETQSIGVANVPNPNDFSIDDVGAINDAVSAAVAQTYNPSPNMTNAMQSLNSEIDTISVNYLKSRYLADSTNVSVDNGSTFVNSISNVLLAHATYSQTIDLTDSERTAFTVALMAADYQIVTNAPAFEAQIFQTQSLIKNNIRVNGFFSWLKNNILAPVVTFVVKTTLFVGAMFGGALLGGALLAADYLLGLTIGGVAGYVAVQYLSHYVDSALSFVGLYNPNFDFGNFGNIVNP